MLAGDILYSLRVFKASISAVYEFLWDIVYHLRYALYYKNELHYTKDSLRCSMMLLAHQLEKAQTYPRIMEGYGREKLLHLLDEIERYVPEYGHDDVSLPVIGVIKSHLNNSHSWKSDEATRRCADILSAVPANLREAIALGGSTQFDPSACVRISNWGEFIRTRRSCRVFSLDPIPMGTIEGAIREAMTAPSACNRQTTRVHVYEDKETIRKLIESQEADVDWCLDADKLLIVTTNRYYFRDVTERYQGMFDSGLFAMLLNLSLHNRGIGCCFKMAQKRRRVESETRKVGGIPEYEDVDVLLLVGKFPSHPIVAAKSARLGIESIMRRH